MGDQNTQPTADVNVAGGVPVAPAPVVEPTPQPVAAPVAPAPVAPVEESAPVATEVPAVQSGDGVNTTGGVTPPSAA